MRRQFTLVPLKKQAKFIWWTENLFKNQEKPFHDQKATLDHTNLIKSKVDTSNLWTIHKSDDDARKKLWKTQPKDSLFFYLIDFVFAESSKLILKDQIK